MGKESTKEQSLDALLLLLILCSLQGAQADLLAAGVLQQILGGDPQSSVKWGSNTISRYATRWQGLHVYVVD